MMELTLEYLQYQLYGYGYLNTVLCGKKEASFQTYYLWDGQLAGRDCLYIVPPEDMHRISPLAAAGCAFLLWQEAEGQEPCGFANALILKSPANIPALVNILNHIFYEYHDWDRLLTLGGPDRLEELFRRSQSIFRFPLLLIDKFFNTIAHTPGVHPLSARQEPYIQELVMARRDPAARGPEEGPFIYRDSSTNQLLLCLNLKVNGRFFARLTGEIPDSQLPAALTRLFARMGSSLEDMLALSRLSSGRNAPKKSRSFCRCLDALSQGSEPDSLEPLAQYGWKLQDLYDVVIFELNQDLPPETSAGYLSEQITSICYDCYTQAEGTRLFCVRNLRLSLYNKEDFHQELIYFLRENVIKSGFSMIFKDLKKMPLYRRQAEEALSLGKKYNPTQWCYLFSQYQLQHLLSTPYPARDVCCQALFTLMEIDRKKGSDLYQTLKSYLYNQGNATKTSEELFIHRTTLIYRIKAISELTGISLENPDTYLHLLLSCRILEQQDYLL